MSDLGILHICLSKGWGGLEMYPIRTGKWFAEQGNRVYGLCIKGTRVAAGMAEAKIPCMAVTTKNQLIFARLPALIRWIKQHRISIVHCHKSGDLLIARLISLFCSVRIIFTEHMGVTRPKKDLFHRWVYQCVDQVLSISNETYQRNLKALPVAPEKIARLWLGTDMIEPMTDPQCIHATRQQYNIGDQQRVIGIIGRISPGKGHLELVRAFDKIHQSAPNTRLLIVGGTAANEGCDLAYLSQLKTTIETSKLSDAVIFTGFQTQTDRLFAIMDMVCLPYANEAFGLTTIEAMAAQKAIVAANTGALPEILDNTGLLCSPHDPEAIANTIQQLMLDTRLRTTLATQARHRAEQEFSTEQHMQKLNQYYLNQ